MHLFTLVKLVRFRILQQNFKHYKSILTHKAVCSLLHIQHICSTNNTTLSSSVPLVLRGLSVKILNNLNTSFSHIIQSYCWASSHSKYSPPLFIHHSQHFFQFWKHFWEHSFWNTVQLCKQIFFNLLDGLKSSSFQYGFQLGEEKQVHWCKV